MQKILFQLWSNSSCSVQQHASLFENPLNLPPKKIQAYYTWENIASKERSLFKEIRTLENLHWNLQSFTKYFFQLRNRLTPIRVKMYNGVDIFKPFYCFLGLPDNNRQKSNNWHNFRTLCSHYETTRPHLDLSDKFAVSFWQLNVSVYGMNDAV